MEGEREISTDVHMFRLGNRDGIWFWRTLDLGTPNRTTLGRNKGISARRWVDILSASFFCLVQWIQSVEKSLRHYWVLRSIIATKALLHPLSKSLDVLSRHKAQHMQAQ